MNTILITKDVNEGLRRCHSCKGVKFEVQFSYTTNGNKFRKQCNDCADKNVANYEFGDIVGLKTCSRCDKVKFTASFLEYSGKGRRNKYGHTTRHHSYCKECSKFYRSEWKNGLSPEKRAVNAQARRLKLYGLTQERFLYIYNKQKGKCGICGVPALEMTHGLHIDHCHDSDQVRGLLCTRCNKALGLLGDNYNALKRALDYLAEFESKRFYPASVNRRILFKNKQ